MSFSGRIFPFRHSPPIGKRSKPEYGCGLATSALAFMFIGSLWMGASEVLVARCTPSLIDNGQWPTTTRVKGNRIVHRSGAINPAARAERFFPAHGRQRGVDALSPPDPAETPPR